MASRLSALLSLAQALIVITVGSNGREVFDEGLQSQEATSDTLIVTEEQKVHASNESNGNLELIALQPQVSARHVDGACLPAVQAEPMRREADKSVRTVEENSSVLSPGGEDSENGKRGKAG